MGKEVKEPSEAKEVKEPREAKEKGTNFPAQTKPT